jgi:UDP-N-acetylglucosamine--N-acetylmuramyl-(pentapeptide) pyrophosphoryl-undecaprenol N-acetylglucosamine transferase
MRVMITGGGTGGHTSPAVAIVEELQRRDPKLHLQWVGRRGGIEERVSREREIPFRHVPVEGWPRKKRLRRIWVGLKLLASFLRAVILVRVFQPQIVLGVGGYVSLPLVWVAQRMGVHTVLHEQNKRLGMANRIGAARASRLFLSYEDTLGDFSREAARVVGNPVRAEFLRAPDRMEARNRLNLDPDVPVVLVCGGSQGAHSLNQAIGAIMSDMAAGELQLIWMTGKADEAWAQAIAETLAIRIDVFAFIDDMASACAAADLIVSRAGASSTAEIAALGKPSILIPYPHATDNHQEQNARAFEEAGAARVLLDKDCDGDSLSGVLKSLLGDPETLRAMGSAALGVAQPLAAEVIAEEMMVLVFEDGAPKS